MSPTTNVTALNVDLHSHSTVSDGTMAPADLVSRAHDRGVQLLALTDHDEVRGLAEARARAEELGLHFVPGVEISVTFAGRTVHIVGLNIDPEHKPLLDGLGFVRSGRMRRAQAMAAALATAGIDDTLAGALRHVANPELVSRTHFARHLVERGVASDVRAVFANYLADGKPGYVPHQWASLAQAVGWINDAGGAAVIAHPGRYRFTETEQWALIEEFKRLGGAALEVATSNHTAEQVQSYARLAREFKLEGSRGSDFHGPGESHAELGATFELPRDLPAVWDRFV